MKYNIGKVILIEPISDFSPECLNHNHLCNCRLISMLDMISKAICKNNNIFVDKHHGMRFNSFRIK